MAHWERPYPASTDRVVAVGVSGVLAVVSAGLTMITLAALIDGAFGSAAGSGAGAALTALAAGFAFFGSRAGLFVDVDEGVLIRRLDRTRCWPWSAIARVEARPAGLVTYGLPAGRETLWLVLN